MKLHKRILTAFLAVMLCMSTFAGISVQAAATTVHILSLPRGADPNKAGWGYSPHTFMNGASFTSETGADTGKWYMYGLDSYNGQIAYCIEPGVVLSTGTSMGARGEDYWDNYPSNINPTIPPYIVKATIGRIMQYGYTGPLNSNWSSAVSGNDTAIAQAIATQLLIWETIVGERDSNFNHVWGSSVGRSNVIDIIAGNHPLRSLIFSYYNTMETQVQQHTQLPSFFSHASGAAVEMTWNGSLYTATFTDTNGVLGNYSFSADKTGVNVSVSGNQLTVTTATPPTGNITLTASKIDATRYGVVVWSDGVINGGKQDLATYSAGVADPVTGYLNLEVKTGNMRLVKTAEDGNVGGISFNISGNGVNTSRTTDASGEISIVGLAPGVYTVTEQSPTQYEPAQAQQFTVVSGQTTTVNFNNVLKRGGLQVVKTSEDGLVEGMTFKLSGTSLSGAAVEQYATTNASGIAVFNDVLISGTTPYVLEEVDTPTRYVVPPTQNVAIAWNTVTNKTVHNVLKKFRVTVSKTDAETSTPQGDGSLAGAVYGIYKGATLIDSYTTDANGQFTTDANGQFTTEYYACGDDWTIKEITPSEGYLLDETVHPVGASAGNFTIELNGVANAVTEQVIELPPFFVPITMLV